MNRISMLLLYTTFNTYYIILIAQANNIF